MLSCKGCLIFIESVRNKDGNIISPYVPWCCRQDDPLVLLDNMKKRLNPHTAAGNTILVENEKRIFHPGIFLDIVPGINDDVILIEIK